MHLATLPSNDTGQLLSRFDSEPLPILEALDCLRVAVTLYDPHERLIYLNRHFGYLLPSMPPPASLIGRSYEELIRAEINSGHIAPQDYQDDEAAYVETRRAQLSNGDYRPRDIHLSNGRIVELKIRRTQGGGWIALWSDVTDARHTMARLGAAVELSADAFAFWDCNDRLVLCNPEFAVLHGGSPNDDLKGLHFEDMLATVTQRQLVHYDGDIDEWMEKRRQKHRDAVGATTVTMSDGRAYLVRERVTRDGGRATVYTDVTDRHRTETAFAEQSATLRATRSELDNQANYLADLSKRLDQAEQSAKTAKTTFLRTMSHELKTPLNAILGFSDLLKSAPGHFSGEQIGEYAGLIHMAGGNLLTMLNQILDLTKIAAGQYPLHQIAMPVRMLFDNAYDRVCELAEDKAINLVIADIDPALDIDGDENALTTMVGELAYNAVKFTQNGGTVTLSALRKGDRAVLHISDDGPGVETAEIARITEPFEQVGRDAAGHHGGAGLGLPLVKALAELHDGTLTLDSRLGEGFTATLDLPAV